MKWLIVELHQATGTPARTVRVEAHRGVAGSQSEIGHATTNGSEARIALDATFHGPLVLTAHDGKHFGVTRLDWPTATEPAVVTVALHPLASIDGRVVDGPPSVGPPSAGPPSAGPPSAGPGELHWQTIGGDWEGDGYVPIDREQRFSIDTLRPGRYALRAGTGDGPATEVLLSPGEHRTGVQIALPKPIAAIEGTVRDTAGDPISGARVLARPSAHPRDAMRAVHAESDEIGRFTLHPTQRGMHLVSASLSRGWSVAGAGPVAHAVPGGAHIVVEPGDFGNDSITGRIAPDDLSHRIAIAVEHGAGITNQVITSERFHVDGIAAGPATVRMGGTGLIPYELRVEVLEGQALDLGMIRLQRKGRVVAEVLDPSGQPVQGAGLYVQPGSATRGAVDASHRPAAVTGPDGKAELAVVDTQWIRVVAWRDGMTAVAQDVGPGQEGALLRFELAPAATLELTGLRSVTAAHLGWRARLTDCNTGTAIVQRSFNRFVGRLEMPGVPPGAYALDIEAMESDGTPSTDTISFPVHILGPGRFVERVDVRSADARERRASTGAPR